MFTSPQVKQSLIFTIRIFAYWLPTSCEWLKTSDFRNWEKLMKSTKSVYTIAPIPLPRNSTPELIGQKLRKSRYQSFFILSSSAWFLWFCFFFQIFFPRLKFRLMKMGWHTYLPTELCAIAICENYIFV